MNVWIYASSEKPPKLTQVLVQCEGLDHPVRAYWMPANTVDQGPLFGDNMVYAVYRPYKEGWYTGEPNQAVPTVLKHKVISWQYAPSWSKV